MQRDLEMSMKRFLVFVIGVALVILPPTSGAQGQEKVHRVGALWAGSASGAAVGAFKQELRRLGYEPGRNIVLEERSVVGELGRLPEVIAELLRLKVDVLIMTSTRAAEAAAKLTTTVPIVVTSSGDLVGTGLAASLARPGRNVTGLTTLSRELTAKRLELLKELVPGVKRVALLWNPEGPVPVLAFKETQAASRVLALEIQSLEVRKPADFEPAFALAERVRVGGLLVLADPMALGNVAKIVKLAAAAGVPAVYPQREFVDAGGLIAYGPSYVDLYRRSAHYVDRILRGAKASELPIEQPAKFELVINAKAAKALKLAIPTQVLIRADAVIE
jgi:putative ABC transport system substrate-binding protein